MAELQGSGRINWRDKCQILEASLDRFRLQALKIREALGDQMRELEEKATAAEQRAKDSEQQLKLMEQRLAAMNWKPQDLDKRIQELENSLEEKNQKILSLEKQLDEQKQNRQQDAKLVEEKAVKIKQWVAHKLRELEEQNQSLQVENELLQEQVGVLRDRLRCLPASTAKAIYRVSLQETSSSRSTSETTIPPDTTQDPPSLTMDMMASQEHTTSESSSSSSSSSQEGELAQMSEGDSEISEIDPNRVYQEVDQNHESKYEPKRLFPPQIKIERKFFPDMQQLKSMVSSSNGIEIEEILDHQTAQPLRSKGQGAGKSDLNSSKPSIHTPISMMLKTPHNPLPPFLPYTPPSSPISIFARHHSSHNVSAIATLPRTRGDRTRPSIPLKLLQEHIFEPLPKECAKTSATDRKSDFLSCDSVSSPEHSDSKITTPPAQRVPSWEGRVYAVVWKGEKGKEGPPLPEKRCVAVESPTSNHLYKDVSVPVYATLKGKAAQIRSTPFMEDTTSDSSEDDAAVSCGLVSTPAAEFAQMMAGPGGAARLSPCSLVRKQPLNQSSSGATKRGVSCHSGMSEVSSDYAVPPDDVSSKSDSENSEPEQKILKYATDSQKHDTLEKCGFLSKLGGKVKMWKRKWFVLRNGVLYYYKSQHDVLRKPQGHITLDGQTKISKSQGELTFEITNSKRTYYLTADSSSEVDRWVRLITKVVKRQASSFLLDQVESKAVVRGWVTRVKNGITRRCWCVLLGRYFLHYKTPTDKTPMGQLNLRDARLEEVENADDSDEESNSKVGKKHVIAIWPPMLGPTYIIIPTKQEKDSWLYHLTVAAGGGTGNVGTEFEQLVAKVMEVNGNLSSVFWKHPLLLHTKEPIARPLTTLPSEDLQERAVELFKLVFQFMNAAIDSRLLDYHVNLAQSILGLCIDHAELQNELYCQLIRQTSRHPVQQKMGVQNLLLCGKHSWFICDGAHKSPTSSVMDLSESKLNPAPHVIIQGWQLLSMCVSLFLPKQTVMWLLKVHLHRHADPRTETGKYAIFCQRGLERTIQKGSREARPSRMEVMSILLRHPYHHSQPISIPVHFLNDTYQVISFDGSTTVQEFLQSLSKTMVMRDGKDSGFALFTDDPAGGEIEHCLPAQIKVCDVISKWEQAFRDNNSGKIDSSRTIRFIFKNRLYFKTTARHETEKEKLLLTYQISDDIVQGCFPLNKDLAVELASLMAQIEIGDVKSGDSSLGTNTSYQLNSILDKFYPRKYREVTDDELRVLLDTLLERWAALRGRTVQDCVRIYLTVARKWPFCGAKLFLAYCKGRDQSNVWLAVQEEGIAVLDYLSLQPLSIFDYKSVVTFGGWKDDFMLVVNQLIESAPHHYEHRTEKLLFILPKPKILQITLLIASYINFRLQQASPEGADDV